MKSLVSCYYYNLLSLIVGSVCLATIIEGRHSLDRDE